MTTPDTLLPLVEQILNLVGEGRDELEHWSQTEDGQKVIQYVVQIGKYNTNVGEGKDFSIGDRLDRVLLEEVRELLRSQQTPSLPNIDWQQISRSLLDEQIQRLTTNPLTHAEGITYRTEQLYVPLGLVERKRQARRREDVSPEQGSLLYEETEITQKFEHEAFLEQVLRQGQSPRSGGRRIAVIGEPGAGKTTLLQQTARWVSENIYGAIVIWVSLADLQGQELEDYLLERWLPAVVQQIGQAEASTQIKDAFVAQFQQGQVWLLLDGVDEMQVLSGNPLSEMERQVRLGGLLSQARIVLTCRLNLWDGNRHALDTFDVYRTLEFAYPRQVEQFVGQWLGALPKAQVVTITTGDRAVVIGGSADRAVIVTGDGNTVITQTHKKTIRPKREERLMRFVNTEISVRLEQLLYNEVLIQLGLEMQSQKVKCPWDCDIKIGNKPLKHVPELTSIVSIYDQSEIAGKLLILGNPGAGKTTAILELAKELCHRAKNDSGNPIPVIFDLSNWKTYSSELEANQNRKKPVFFRRLTKIIRFLKIKKNGHQAISSPEILSWLISELKSKYHVHIRDGKKLFSEDRCILLLDGLDELETDFQRSCLIEINKFINSKFSPNSIVVTSRNEEYSNLQEQLELNGAIYLNCLEDNQIYKYLLDINRENLCDLLKGNRNLLELVRSPFFLNILVLSTYGDTISDWSQKDLKYQEIFLFNYYINQMLNQTPGRSKYLISASNKQVKRWLVYLSKYLKKSDNPDFFIIEKIQPNILENSTDRRFYRLSLGLLLGLSFGLISTMVGIGLGQLSFSLSFGVSGTVAIFLIIGLDLILVFFSIVRFLVSLYKDAVAYSDNYFITTFSAAVEFIAGMLPIVLVIAANARYENETIIITIFKFIFNIILEHAMAFRAEIYNTHTLVGAMSGLILGVIIGVVNLTDIIIPINKIDILNLNTQWFRSFFNINTSERLIPENLDFDGVINILFFILFISFGFIFSSYIAGTILGLSLGGVSGSILGLFKGNILSGLAFGLNVGHNVTPMFLLCLGFLWILAKTLNSEDTMGDYPNKGIFNSAKNSFFIGIFIAILMFFGKNIVLAWIKFLGFKGMHPVIEVFTLLFISAVYFGFQEGGGKALAQHFSLRLILYFNNLIPWNYAQFLNYCTQRRLLQRVGGRYRFIHRLLQKHFVTMSLEKGKGDR